MDRPWDAVRLSKPFDLVRGLNEQINLNSGPTVDGLIVVPRDDYPVCPFSNLLRHLPLQRREVLSLVNKQIVQARGITDVDVLLDHVNEIILAHHRLVLVHLLVKLNQLGVEQIPVPLLVELLLQCNHPIPSAVL